VLIKPKAKPAVRSRTLWFNTLMVFAAGSVIISDILELAYSVGLTVPEKMMMWVLFGVGLVNIALRYRTDCPIGSGESGDHLPQGTTMRR
jgi:magnesium-transporting ATPase (P-type)